MLIGYACTDGGAELNLQRDRMQRARCERVYEGVAPAATPICLDLTQALEASAGKLLLNAIAYLKTVNADGTNAQKATADRICSKICSGQLQNEDRRLEVIGYRPCISTGSVTRS